MRALLERLGKPGVIGLGILLFCLSYWVGSVAPARQELADLNAESVRLAASVPAMAGQAGPDAGDRKFPPFSTATDTLKILDDLAVQHGLTLERASYRLVDAEGTRRLEMTVPLKAGYVPLRAWLREVLALPESPTLDDIVLRRRQASEPQVDAEIRLSFHFAPP